MSRSLVVGVYSNDQHLLALLRAILIFAGHTISNCAKKEQTPRAFLKNSLASLTNTSSAPYDLLIIAIPSHELTGPALTFLEQLAAFELFPIVLLTEDHYHPLELLRTRVTVIPFLFQHVFRVHDLVDAVEMTTGISFPLSPRSTQMIAQWQQAQYQEAIQARQRWIDHRQEWLRQRQEWIAQREECLLQLRLWIDVKCQCPEAQQEWLQEQQCWVDGQQREIDQQDRLLQHQHHWLRIQQTNLNQLRMQSLLKDAT